MPVAMANAFALLLPNWKLLHAVKPWPLRVHLLLLPHPPLQVHLRLLLKLPLSLMHKAVRLLPRTQRLRLRWRLLRRHHRNLPSPWSPCAGTTVLALGKSSQRHRLAVANLVIAAKAVQVTDATVLPRVGSGETRVAQAVPAGLVTGVVGSTTDPSAAHAWETRPSAPSATRWITHRRNCASWLLKRTVKH